LPSNANNARAIGTTPAEPAAAAGDPNTFSLQRGKANSITSGMVPYCLGDGLGRPGLGLFGSGRLGGAVVGGTGLVGFKGSLGSTIGTSGSSGTAQSPNFKFLEPSARVP